MARQHSRELLANIISQKFPASISCKAQTMQSLMLAKQARHSQNSSPSAAPAIFSCHSMHGCQRHCSLQALSRHACFLPSKTASKQAGYPSPHDVWKEGSVLLATSRASVDASQAWWLVLVLCTVWHRRTVVLSRQWLCNIVL